jgi:hypothetical protein
VWAFRFIGGDSPNIGQHSYPADCLHFSGPLYEVPPTKLNNAHFLYVKRNFFNCSALKRKWHRFRFIGGDSPNIGQHSYPADCLHFFGPLYEVPPTKLNNAHFLHVKSNFFNCSALKRNIHRFRLIGGDSPDIGQHSYPTDCLHFFGPLYEVPTTKLNNARFSCVRNNFLNFGPLKRWRHRFSVIVGDSPYIGLQSYMTHHGT